MCPWTGLRPVLLDDWEGRWKKYFLDYSQFIVVCLRYQSLSACCSTVVWIQMWNLVFKFSGSLVTCHRCAFAWHKSCVLVGSHYVNRKLDKFVLCPRHAELEKKSKVHTQYCVGCEKMFGKYLLVVLERYTVLHFTGMWGVESLHALICIQGGPRECNRFAFSITLWVIGQFR